MIVTIALNVAAVLFLFWVLSYAFEGMWVALKTILLLPYHVVKLIVAAYRWLTLTW